MDPGLPKGLFSIAKKHALLEHSTLRISNFSAPLKDLSKKVHIKQENGNGRF